MNRFAQWAPGAVAWLGIALVCGVPLAYAVAGAAQSAAWPEFDARSARLLLNSIAVSGGAAVFACALGVPAGFALGRLRTRGQRLLACAAAVPFLVPPYVSAIAWIELTGARSLAAQAVGGPIGWIYSPLGAAWVLGAGYLTLPAAAVVLAAYSSALSGVGPARHARGGFAVFTRVAIPAVRPYVAASVALVFLLSLSEFAVPSLLQVPVYPVEIHTQFAVNFNPGRALATSAPTMLVGLSVLAFIAAYVRRAARPLGERVGADPVNLPRTLHRAVTVGSWTIFAIAAGLPLAAIVRRAESLDALREAWATAGAEIGASASIGTAAASICVLVAFIAMQSNARPVWRATAAFVAALAFLLPGPAAGIALIDAWNHPGARAGVYDGPAILVLACSARLLAVAMLVSAVVRVSRARAWDDAARVFAVPAWRRQLWIALPASAPAIVLAWAVVFVLSAREADASALVAPPGFTTIAVRLLALMHYGPSAVVAGLSLLLVAATVASAAVLAGAAWLTLRWVYGAPVRS